MSSSPSPASEDHQRLNRQATTLSVAVAVVLIALKAFALGASGSVSILASLADSALDLLGSLGAFFAVRWAAAPPDAERLPTAWERHTAVATATSPVEDGLGDDPAPGKPLRPLPRVMVGSTAAMVVVTVGLTALAGPLYGVAQRAADDLRERGPYISAVFGGEEVP